MMYATSVRYRYNVDALWCASFTIVFLQRQFVVAQSAACALVVNEERNRCHVQRIEWVRDLAVSVKRAGLRYQYY